MYARHQAALAALTQSVLANTDLPALMRQAVTLAAHTLAVGYSAIWELRPDSNTLALRFGAGWPEDAVNRSTIVVEATCPIGSTLLGAAPTIVADWPGEIWFRQPALLHSHRVISSAYVVIPGPASPFGSLGVDVTASRMFSDEELHFLQAVANVLALAIEREQAHQALEQRAVDR